MEPSQHSSSDKLFCLSSFLRRKLAVFTLGAALLGASAQAALLETRSTFNAGAAEGWVVNDGSVVMDAGQLGIGDHVLGYSSLAGEGFFPQTATNSTFLGDYEDIGALSFEFDAKFVSGSALTLRLYILDTSPVGTSNDYHAVSSWSVSLSSANTDWNHYVISIAPENMMVTRTGFPRTHVGLIGLRHDPNGDGPTNSDPVAVQTTVYFDNFKLTANVPEPGTASLLLLGLAAVCGRRMRRS